MAMVWKVVATRLAEIQEEGTGSWEPFGVFWDPDEMQPMILCRGLFEEEGEKSSTKPENTNWMGNEPDAKDFPVKDKKKKKAKK